MERIAIMDVVRFKTIKSFIGIELTKATPYNPHIIKPELFTRKFVGGHPAPRVFGIGTMAGIVLEKTEPSSLHYRAELCNEEVVISKL